MTKKGKIHLRGLADFVNEEETQKAEAAQRRIL